MATLQHLIVGQPRCYVGARNEEIDGTGTNWVRALPLWRLCALAILHSAWPLERVPGTPEICYVWEL